MQRNLETRCLLKFNPALFVNCEVQVRPYVGF